MAKKSKVKNAAGGKDSGRDSKGRIKSGFHLSECTGKVKKAKR